MANAVVQPNGIASSNWASPSGTIADIDEPVASADGSTYSAGADSANQSITLDLASPGITDADTITNVSITVRTADTGTAGNSRMDVELLIGGVSQGTVTTGNTTGTLANYGPLNIVGWNTDWSQTQADGAQVRLTATQVGKAGTNIPILDAVDVDFTYTPGAAGVVPQIVHHRNQMFGSD